MTTKPGRMRFNLQLRLLNRVDTVPLNERDAYVKRALLRPLSASRVRQRRGLATRYRDSLRLQ